MDRPNFVSSAKPANSTTTGSISSKPAVTTSGLAMSFSVSGRNTNNSNNAAFSATTTVTNTTSRNNDIRHHSNHHHNHGNHHPHHHSSSNNNHNDHHQHHLGNINEDDNISSDLSEEIDFDRPASKHRKKPKKVKPKVGNRETPAKSGLVIGRAADDDDEDDEDDDDNEEEEGGGGGGITNGSGQKRGCDAESVGSPKTPTAQTPTSADPDVEIDSGSASKRSKSGGKQQKLSGSAKFLLDKKRLEPHIGEGEVLVPVPRARRRLKGGELGYMVKKGDTVVRYIDKDGIIYNPTDTAYLQNREKGKPYFVCAIQKFNLTKRDTLMVGVKWFFRLSEVPGSVYHHLTLDRELHKVFHDVLRIHVVSVVRGAYNRYG
ncbi:arginine-glutamic acid dipeptide (RE) repeats a [Elysia marginata]|uniref:Arginine-glutamic acid dipeptide (RE) repeats a n=1 Tax=Elysia marginata TaxID=1093978 RepID=A0AAV4HIN3_9GAST|nr:arginine-glutamic acid dipeptide (RE) repeats a [Elysia marginata]